MYPNIKPQYLSNAKKSADWMERIARDWNLLKPVLAEKVSKAPKEWVLVDEAEKFIEEINPDAPSGAADKDLGTCSNPYWQGNGLTYEEASKNNPYWGGSWGN